VEHSQVNYGEATRTSWVGRGPAMCDRLYGLLCEDDLLYLRAHQDAVWREEPSAVSPPFATAPAWLLRTADPL
jgi:hypothetical protein